jgi:putative hydrolase of the HAD superfamily
MSDAEKESTTQDFKTRLTQLIDAAAAGEEVVVTRGGKPIILTEELRKRLWLKDAAPSPKFDAILFDVGGVLLTNGWDHHERAAVLQHFNLDRAEFESRHEQPNDAWERDALTIQGYLDTTVFYQPRSFTPAGFIEVMKAQSVPIPSNAMPVLKEIAQSGNYLIGTLNNESRELHQYRMATFGLNPYLDLQLCSAYVGMRKPDADIYRRAIDIVGRPASRILFIDDRAANADAARAAGMTAIQFLGEEQLRAQLKELEIL